MMRRTKLMLGVVVACVLAVLHGTARADQAAPNKEPALSGPTYRVLTLPKVRLEPGLIDFGDVRPGMSVSQDVEIFNESEVPIRIARTVSTCRCTVATPKKEDIAPGESVSVTITLDTGELTGAVTRYIQVQFAGGARPLAIAARAYVSDGIRGDVRYEQPDRDDVFLIDLVEPKGRAFRVLDVSGQAPVYAKNAPGDGEGLAEHHLRLERGADEARLWLAIETDHPEAPLVVLPLDPNAMGDVEIRPTWIFSKKRIIERRLVPGEARDVVVELRGIGADDQGDITSVRVHNERVSAEVTRVEGVGSFASNVHIAMTPEEDVRGLVHTMVEISARGFTQAIDLILLMDRPVSMETVEALRDVEPALDESAEIDATHDEAPLKALDEGEDELLVEPAIEPASDPEQMDEEDGNETPSIRLPSRAASRN